MKVATGIKYQTLKEHKIKQQAWSKRQAATDVWPTSHNNSDQQPRNPATASMWCVRGVLCSKYLSAAGRHGRIARGVVCGCCVFYGGKELHTAVSTLSATRRQFERPETPGDKLIAGPVGWCHDAKHTPHVNIIPGACRLARDAAFPPS